MNSPTPWKMSHCAFFDATGKFLFRVDSGSVEALLQMLSAVNGTDALMKVVNVAKDLVWLKSPQDAVEHPERWLVVQDALAMFAPRKEMGE